MQITFTDTAALRWDTDEIAARVVVALPFIDRPTTERAAAVIAGRAAFDDATLVCVEDRDREGFIAVANLLFSRSRSALFGYLATDSFPCRTWLKRAIACHAAQPFGVLAFNDGKWFGTLASIGLVDRDWVGHVYENALFHDGYHSHYADTELSAIAGATGRLAYDPNIAVVEVDYDKERQSVAIRDKELYRARCARFKALDGWVDPSWFDRFS